MPTGLVPMFLGAVIPLVFTAAFITLAVVAVIFMIKGIAAFNIYIRANKK